MSIWQFFTNLFRQPAAVSKSESTVVHKSRFGFHACDYDTYRKLKLLAQYERRAYAQYKTWLRWSRKAPQNRVIRERIRNDQGLVVSYRVVGPRQEPTITNQHFWLNGFEKLNFIPLGAVQAYNIAKTPFPTPESVVPIKMSAYQIDNALEMLKAFMPMTTRLRLGTW